MLSIEEQGSIMKIRLINRRAVARDTYDSVADNIFTDVCEDIQIQSPIIARPDQDTGHILRPVSFSQTRRVRVV
jgi:hypothetical protein